jgi:hypothetical protein
MNFGASFRRPLAKMWIRAMHELPYGNFAFRMLIKRSG